MSPNARGAWISAGTAAAVRLAWFLEFRTSPFWNFLHLDPLYYKEWAERIVAGDWIGHRVFEMSPLYAYLLAAYIGIFGESFTLLRLMQFAVGAATAGLTCLLAGRLFGRWAGLAAGLLAALYGPFLFFEGQVMKEFLTPFLSCLALVVFYGALDARGRRRLILLAAAGACIGVAALVRDNILVVLPCLGLYLVASRRGAGLKEACVMGAATMVVLLPVGIRNYAVSGDVVLTTSGGGEVFYIGNGPYANGAYIVPPWVRSSPKFEHEDFRKKARELTGRDLSRAEASHFWWREGLKTILSDPLHWAGLELRKAALFLNDYELPDNYSYGSFERFSRILPWLPTFGVVLALGIVGIVATAGAWRTLMPLYLAGGGYMASVMLVFNFGRFRLPFVPLLCALAGAGLVALAGSLRDARRGGWARAVVYVVVAAAAWGGSKVDLHSSAEEPFQDRLHVAAAYLQAGEPKQAETILRETIRDAEKVLTEHGWKPGDASIPGGISFALSLHAAHRDLARVLMNEHRESDAIAEMRAAIPFDPSDADLFQMLGGALTETGDLHGAVTALRRAVELKPDRFTARFDLATALYEEGNAAAALEELQEAKKRSSNLGKLDLADWHYGMGAVLLALPGRESEGLDHLREGLALNPSHPHADEARAALARAGSAP